MKSCKYIVLITCFIFLQNSFSQEDSLTVDDFIIYDDDYGYEDEEYYADDEYEEYEEKDFGIADTLIYESKVIPIDTIDEYLSNPAFRYKKKGNLKQPKTNWLGKFLNALERLFANTLGFSFAPWIFPLIKLIFIAVLIGLVGYWLAYFSGLKINFKKKKKKKIQEISFETIEENLEIVDFDMLIEQAIKEKSYRIVVRLFFLKNLQSLTKKEKIYWAIDKTNNDYKYELADTKLLPSFEQTVYLFEHIWYGNFEISDTEFQQIINKFRDFQKEIRYEK